MKTKNNDEDFQFKMKNQTNQKKETLHEHKCNERYPCYNVLWHLTEHVSNILFLPTWVWKRTIDNNNLLYYWLTKLMHLPNRYEQQCYAFKETT